MNAHASNVICLPWVKPEDVRPTPLTVKSLVIRREGRGAAVILHPAVTGAERRVRETFDSIDVARVYAHRLRSMYPKLYRRIIDETGGTA